MSLASCGSSVMLMVFVVCCLCVCGYLGYFCVTRFVSVELSYDLVGCCKITVV